MKKVFVGIAIFIASTFLTTFTVGAADNSKAAYNSCISQERKIGKTAKEASAVCESLLSPSVKPGAGTTGQSSVTGKTGSGGSSGSGESSSGGSSGGSGSSSGLTHHEESAAHQGPSTKAGSDGGSSSGGGGSGSGLTHQEDNKDYNSCVSQERRIGKTPEDAKAACQYLLTQSVKPESKTAGKPSTGGGSTGGSDSGGSSGGSGSGSGGTSTSSYPAYPTSAPHGTEYSNDPNPNPNPNK